ncbi:hypothetical protein LTR78_007498 [Recurvomyces mirabilis]|uniref:Major facilitator superfamily (MFS) profile domain-containing protein n=1 Tax=Recurvomyces mirabilis TaxID=574656 RepID=A0AAE0TSD0_9PEZI|nr:hypothetical protein LTR78_007498 [Recurvomyces mirabilis]KAK5159992.1 hypothetical protein LTS14_002098 [Recurvomyces mirabilis]
MGKEKLSNDSPVNEAIGSGSPNGHDPLEMDGLTLYEKKCVLINHEIDNNGMGRYQWYIWGLCGFGYMLDLLWAQAFGLVLSPLEQELGFSLSNSGNISVAFSAGLTAGAFFWGVLVDIIGRQWAFNLTCLISAVFGLGLGGCNSYTAFLVVTAFVGFGIGGNIPIDTTICLEFIPQNRRFLLALLSIFQPIGVVVCSAIAYGFIPKFSCSPNFSEANPLLSCNVPHDGQACCTRQSNMGWRYLMFTLGAITLGVFILRFVVFRFKESPKFLVYRGHDEKAIATLEHIAKFNKRACGISLADFEALTGEHNSTTSATELIGTGSKQLQRSTKEKIMIELARYKMLFNGWQMTRLTILVWLTYICDFWGFTLAGTYLPTILAKKNGSINLSLEFTYRTYLAIYAPGIVGVVLGTMMYSVPSVGRKWTMVISSGLMGISMFVFSAVNTEASNIGLNVMEYFFQSMFNAVLYGWTPEVFPAPIRGTACGVASFWGRLFGIIAPLTAQSLLPSGSTANDGPALNRVLYLAGGITLGCVLTVSLLPNKVLGRQSM